MNKSRRFGSARDEKGGALDVGCVFMGERVDVGRFGSDCPHILSIRSKREDYHTSCVAEVDIKLLT